MVAFPFIDDSDGSITSLACGLVSNSPQLELEVV
jgi:hypothetical protein